MSEADRAIVTDVKEAVVGLINKHKRIDGAEDGHAMLAIMSQLTLHAYNFARILCDGDRYMAKTILQQCLDDLAADVSKMPD